EIARRDGDEFREPANRPEAGPAHVGANLRVPHLAMTAGAVAPSGHDYDVVALVKSRRLGHGPADLVHDAGDFVAQRDRPRDAGILPEVSIHELHVGAAHAARRDLDEDLIGLKVRNRYVLEDESLAIFVHACGFHSCSPFTVVGIKEAPFLRVPCHRCLRRVVGYLGVLDPDGLRVYKGVLTEVCKLATVAAVLDA